MWLRPALHLGLALLPAQEATPVQVEAAIERGVDFLSDFVAERPVQRQLGLGVAGTLADERKGVLALAAYALLVSGVERSDPSLRRLIAELAFVDPKSTYDTACTLFAIVEHDPLGHRRWVAELADRLVGWQSSGVWGYPEGGDLSNTQYAALGLWAASKAGVHVPVEAWRSLADTLSIYEAGDGGFVYAPGGHGATGSMTAAGVGTLALCELVLARREALDEDLATKLRSARGRGLEWLAEHFRPDSNPGSASWTYYWLYGVERMGALTGLTFLGQHDWYAEGAAWLLEEQHEDGSWSGGSKEVTTAFALLFLCRATAVHAPQSGPTARPTPESLESIVQVGIDQTPDGSVTFRLKGLHRSQLAGLCWPGEAPKPRVVRVEYLVDGRVVAAALGDGEQRPRGNSFAAVVRTLSPERHEVRARVSVRAPPQAKETGEAGAEHLVVLESPPLWLDHETAAPPWRRSDPRGPANRIAGVRVEARASSVLTDFDEVPGATFAAGNAVDGKHRRPWLAREHDREPSLRLSFRGVMADRVRLVPPRIPGFDADALGRPLEVELEINGGIPRRVTMPPDPEQVVEVVLDEPVRIRQLEVRILTSVPGQFSAATGLGEIELVLTE